MIFSSYFGNVERLRKNGVPENNFIGISLYKCKFENIVRYEQSVCSDEEVFWYYKKGLINWEEYCLKYYNKLHNLGDKFWEDFLVKFNGKVLLCYEKNVKECHRYLLGKYLYWRIGRCKMVEVDENLKFWKIEKTLIKV